MRNGLLLIMPGRVRIKTNGTLIGLGNVCGGVFVDEDFEVLCKNRMGRKWSKFSQADVKLLLNKEWEYSIKPRYSESDPREEYLVTLPIRSLADSELNDTSRKPHIKNGRIHFSGYVCFALTLQPRNQHRDLF